MSVKGPGLGLHHPAVDFLFVDRPALFRRVPVCAASWPLQDMGLGGYIQKYPQGQTYTLDPTQKD